MTLPIPKTCLFYASVRFKVYPLCKGFSMLVVPREFGDQTTSVPKEVTKTMP